MSPDEVVWSVGTDDLVLWLVLCLKFDYLVETVWSSVGVALSVGSAGEAHPCVCGSLDLGLLDSPP